MPTIRAIERSDAGGQAASGGLRKLSAKPFVMTPYIGMIDDRRESAMNLQRFDLNLLVALDALLTEKNVTRAGRRMNLSQSAMSGALARQGFFVAGTATSSHRDHRRLTARAPAAGAL